MLCYTTDHYTILHYNIQHRTIILCYYTLHYSALHDILNCIALHCIIVFCRVEWYTTSLDANPNFDESRSLSLYQHPSHPCWTAFQSLPLAQGIAPQLPPAGHAVLVASNQLHSLDESACHISRKLEKMSRHIYHTHIRSWIFTLNHIATLEY